MSPSELVISAIEHVSISAAAEALERQGWIVRRIAPRPDGAIDPRDLPALLTDRTRMASIMLANNESGVLQPIVELAAICHERGIPLHTDAIQVAGKLPVNFRELGVATLSLAAHKFHGPRGIGGLLIRHGVTVEPFMYGGFQQQGMRPGTESVALAIGMHVALQAWEREATARAQRLVALRTRLEHLLREAWPVVIHGTQAPRLPHTILVSFPGIDRQAMVMALDMAGVACSSGSACASGSSKPSVTLTAMGVPPDLVGSAVRLSLGATTTAEEVELAGRRIYAVCKSFERQNSARNPARPLREPA